MRRSRSSPEPTPAAGEGVESRERLELNPAVTVLWRRGGEVQLELGASGCVLFGIGAEEVARLLPAGRGSGANPEPCAPELAAMLASAGMLSRPGPGSSRPPAHLAADAAALAGRFGGDPAGVLRRRSQAVVTVHGGSRVSASLAATLAAAGVGQVYLSGSAEVSAADHCPGGLTPADEGGRLAMAGAAAINRAAPQARTGIPTGRPSLVVLTEPPPLDPAVRDGLHLDQQAHLAATVSGSRAVIGPLVLPGRSSCLRCADLTRTDLDPGWPLLAAQLAGRPRRRLGSDVALCLAAAGAAAGQVLGFLDGEAVQTLDGTMEWQLPDWRLRRRSWAAHPECDCGAHSRVDPHGRMGS